MDNKTLEILYWVGGTILGTGLLEISPIKINPWSWLLAPLRKALTGDISKKIDNVDTKVVEFKKALDNHIQESQEDKARQARQRILRFDDEIIQKQFHSKESWDQMLEDIDTYEKYCIDHPDYPNNKCVMAINHMKHEYNKCLDDNSFLQIDDEIKNVRKRKKEEH